MYIFRGSRIFLIISHYYYYSLSGLDGVCHSTPSMAIDNAFTFIGGGGGVYGIHLNGVTELFF